MFITPSHKVGSSYVEERNGAEYIYEIEYISQMPLGTEYTTEFMYLCKVYKIEKDKKTFSYQLVQERMLDIYQIIAIK